MNYSFSLFFLRPPFLLPDPIRPSPLSFRDVFPLFSFDLVILLLCFSFGIFISFVEIQKNLFSFVCSIFRISLRRWCRVWGPISGVKIWTAVGVRSQISPTATRPGHSVARRHSTNIWDDLLWDGVLSSRCPSWGWDCTSPRLQEISHPGVSAHWPRPSDKTVMLSVRTVVSVSGPPSCSVVAAGCCWL